MVDIEQADREAEVSQELQPWKLWSEERPTDTKIAYRWRVSERDILGLQLRPEWTEKLHYCGMGYGDSEWWPVFSNWNGYSRSVDPTLEWRPALEDEKHTYWGGLDLLPSPHNGEQPRVSATTRYIGAPEYLVDKLHLHSFLVSSYGWTSAAKMRDAWNTRTEAATTIERYREALEGKSEIREKALRDAAAVADRYGKGLTARTIAHEIRKLFYADAALSHAPEGQPGDGM